MNRHHLFPTYSPPSLRFSHGEGSWLSTTDGHQFLDFIAGISVNTLGHTHPSLVSALTDQAQKIWHLSNMFDVPGQSELAERYCSHCFADRVFFTNSGTESIECALKSARRYHAENGEPDRIDIIGFDGSFHGRSYAAVNASGNTRYMDGFGPGLPGYVQAPFGDLDAVKALVGPQTAAILIEPVQGEGGLRTAPLTYLESLRELCDETGTLLIYDEVQCGAGRTGKLFAHQWSDAAEPDIMATAKGVGGGFPMGMCLATEKIAYTMTPGTHGTTYGGNALAVAVGSAVLDQLCKPGFLDAVCTRADQLQSGLSHLCVEYPSLIEEVRGKGLLTGFKAGMVSNLELRDRLRDDGLLVGVAGDNVVRFAPALNVCARDIDIALAKLSACLSSLSTPPTASSVAPA